MAHGTDRAASLVIIQPGASTIEIPTKAAAVETDLDARIRRAERNRRATVRRHRYVAGYGRKDVDAGLAYCDRHGIDDTRESYIVTMSHTLYGQEEADDGARCLVDEGCGPR